MLLYCFLNVGETPKMPLSALIDLLGGAFEGAPRGSEGVASFTHVSLTHSLTHSLTQSAF